LRNLSRSENPWSFREAENYVLQYVEEF